MTKNPPSLNQWQIIPQASTSDKEPPNPPSCQLCHMVNLGIMILSNKGMWQHVPQYASNCVRDGVKISESIGYIQFILWKCLNAAVLFYLYTMCVGRFVPGEKCWDWRSCSCSPWGPRGTRPYHSDGSQSHLSTYINGWECHESANWALASCLYFSDKNLRKK